MFIRQTLPLFVLLVLMPPLLWGQRVAHPNSGVKAMDLANRTFLVVEVAQATKTPDDVKLFLVFGRDNSATFRAQAGSKVIDRPFSWRLMTDSLYLQPSSSSHPTEAVDVEAQKINRAFVNYKIIKTPDGYLLKRKDDQMRLSELK